MSFVVIFKIDALETPRERYPPDITLGYLQDVFGTLLQKYKTIKQLTLSCFRQTFSEIKLKIMH